MTFPVAPVLRSLPVTLTPTWSTKVALCFCLLFHQPALTWPVGSLNLRCRPAKKGRERITAATSAPAYPTSKPLLIFYSTPLASRVLLSFPLSVCSLVSVSACLHAKHSGLCFALLDFLTFSCILGFSGASLFYSDLTSALPQQPVSLVFCVITFLF